MSTSLRPGYFLMLMACVVSSAVVASDTAPPSAPTAASTTTTSGPLNLSRLNRKKTTPAGAGLFTSSVQLPATSVAEPPPPPSPPPLPFTYLGRITHATGEVFLLGMEGRHVKAQLNEVLDGTYLLSRVEAGHLIFVYLPLSIEQPLSLPLHE